jgi:hypothetical protein
MFNERKYLLFLRNLEIFGHGKHNGEDLTIFRIVLSIYLKKSL